MLQGFHYPLTPKGKSTLNPPPPWYYSADFLNIEFWADPSAVTATLPTGLDADPKADGHANALFYDWQFSGSNEEYLDPARYQYREFFILVDALFEGRPISYCPYIFVDNVLDQFVNRRIFVPPCRQAREVQEIHNRSLMQDRGVPNRLSQCHNAFRKPSPSHRQTASKLRSGGQRGTCVPHDVKMEQAWIGDDSLNLPVCKDEELSDLAPRRCGMGLRASMAYVVDDLKTLKDLRR